MVTEKWEDENLIDKASEGEDALLSFAGSFGATVILIILLIL